MAARETPSNVTATVAAAPIAGGLLSGERWRGPLGYVAVLVLVLVATGARWLLDPVFGDRYPFITFLAALFAFAYVGSPRQTALAAGLSLLIGWYCFVPQRYSLRIPDHLDLIGLVLNFIVFAGIVALSHKVRLVQLTGEERVLAMKAADIASRRLAAIVETSDDAIVAKDLNGIVTGWNRGAERLFGYSAHEMIGQPIQRLIPADRSDEEPTILARLARGERMEHFETVRRRKDGQLIDVSLTISPIRDASGQVVGASKIARDVSERNQARLLNDRLAAIVESSEDGIISKDLRGVITSWNQGAETIFGYTSEEMIGKSVSLLIPAARIDEEPEILARVARGERVEHFETQRQRKDGTIITVSLTISPIRDSAGHIIGASKVARDITGRAQAHAERSQLLESERAARTEAERATRMRDEFLAIVSHELRTPLNGILGWAQLLKRGATDPESLRQGLSAIEQGARAQAQLIDDLLDMNRIMAGKLHLDVQDVHVAAVIESALTTLRPAADARGVLLQTKLATNIAPIRGDPARVQQVVWNLVSNAVKFTPRGGKVQVLLERVNSSIEVSVADTGIGIKPEFLPHVFERFRQADASTTRRHGGLGLGLAIVKQIVELHGGTVGVESLGEGQGATFHVRFPVSIIRRPVSAEIEYVAPAAEHRTMLDGIRALVVDDDAGAAEIVKRMLEDNGAAAAIATSGKDALAQIAHSTPDIVLSDIGMPEMDGYEFIETLRRGGGRVPAIAITAFARAEDRIRTLQAGYGMHLAKPVDARELLTVIQAMLRSTGRLDS